MARAAYSGVVSAEIALAGALARRNAIAPLDPGNLTVLVKTFERPGVLARMLRSIRQVFTGPILVADDSQRPQTDLGDPMTKVITLPFDSGIGAGRNALLAAAETEFVLMADDDMVVLPDFDVRRMVSYLQRNPEVDLVGGRVINLPLWRTANYASAALFAYPGPPRLRQGTIIDGLPVTYKLPNFYVARTHSIRSIGYDGRLKRLDHSDFFTAAFGRLVGVLDCAMVCLHTHSYFDPHYQSFRTDTVADSALIAEKWGRARSSMPTEGAITEAQKAELHHAAVEVVARDLGVKVIHFDGPHDAVRVAAERVDDLIRVLGSMGWRGSRGRRRHGLWGSLRLEAASPQDMEAALPAAFAGIDGLAVSAGQWGPATGRPGSAAADEGGDDGVRWSPRAGFLETDTAIIAAPLPAGPVFALEPPGDAVFAAFGPERRDPDEAIAEVLQGVENAPVDAADQLRSFVEDLIRQGLLER